MHHEKYHYTVFRNSKNSFTVMYCFFAFILLKNENIIPVYMYTRMNIQELMHRTMRLKKNGSISVDELKKIQTINTCRQQQ